MAIGGNEAAQAQLPEVDCIEREQENLSTKTPLN